MCSSAICCPCAGCMLSSHSPRGWPALQSSGCSSSALWLFLLGSSHWARERWKMLKYDEKQVGRKWNIRKEKKEGGREGVSGRGGEPVIRDMGSKRMGAMWRKKIELGSGRNRGLLGAENKVLLTKKKNGWHSWKRCRQWQQIRIWNKWDGKQKA